MKSKGKTKIEAPKKSKNLLIGRAFSGSKDTLTVRACYAKMKTCLFVKAEACNFTKINTPPWVFFTFFKLYKCYQIAQRTTFLQKPSLENKTFDLMI